MLGLTNPNICDRIDHEQIRTIKIVNIAEFTSSRFKMNIIYYFTLIVLFYLSIKKKKNLKISA